MKKLTISLSLIATLAVGTLYASEVKVNNTTAELTPVTVKNFQRAESDTYFNKYVNNGAFGKFFHARGPTPIENQKIVRMNRDTLYSAAIIDLEASPVTITLPDTGKRFMSMQIISEDHYSPAVVYAPGTYTYDKSSIGTRYMAIAIRTFVNATDPADIKVANNLQDQIALKQANIGKFEIPNWDKKSQKEVHHNLAELQAIGGCKDFVRMGLKEEVDDVCHLLATATGWGLNPHKAAVYNTVYPKLNDGKTVYTLTLKDVPIDGFWSVSVYNGKGFFEKNPLNTYSLNNITAKKNADGSYVIQFGGCTKESVNCIYTPKDWNYSFRQYRPKKSLLDGTWKSPEAEPIKI